MQTYWTIVLGCLVAILMAMLIMMFRKKYFLNKLNYVFAMNTVIVLLILTVGFIDGRMDMYLDIALSYSILGFVTQVILAKYIGGRRR
ncbi:MAG: pH regulation protein F [Clostridiales bacterium]|nr:pH regulation protein F [Clostridiales bacterium]